MSTGLVEAMGAVVARSDTVGGRDLTIALPFADQLTVGESVSVNGACLTVVAISSGSARFQLGPETLRLTNLGTCNVGDAVNLERSLRLGDRLGGHLVTGHIDGLGSVLGRQPSGEYEIVTFSASTTLIPQMVRKGSIAIDGVSLTLVDVFADRFTVMLIPHTLAVTTLGRRGVGEAVNLETDLLAKYVHSHLQRMTE